MKKPKSIFFIVYFLFHIALLVVSIYVNYRSEDFEFLLWLRGKMSMMVYVSAIGLILFFINVLVAGLDKRSSEKEITALQSEVNSLKAKMFDLQEASKTTAPAPTPAPAAEEEDKDHNRGED